MLKGKGRGEDTTQSEEEDDEEGEGTLDARSPIEGAILRTEASSLPLSISLSLFPLDRTIVATRCGQNLVTPVRRPQAPLFSNLFNLFFSFYLFISSVKYVP